MHCFKSIQVEHDIGEIGSIMFHNSNEIHTIGGMVGNTDSETKELVSIVELTFHCSSKLGATIILLKLMLL